MGDRANIIIKQHNGEAESELWLYTHWSGADLPEILQTAMRRKIRWSDEAYLARVILCEMIRVSGELDGETGIGITTYETDSSYPFLVVDAKKQEISIRASGRGSRECQTGPWTFAAFCALDLAKGWEAFRTVG